MEESSIYEYVCDLGFDPKEYIKPVRQNFATYSPAVKEFDYMIHRGIQAEDDRIEKGELVSVAYVTIQQIAEALGMTVDIVDERLRDLASLRVLTAE